MIRPLRMLGLDLSLAKTAISRTHDHHGEPALGVRTVRTSTNSADPRSVHKRINTVLANVAAAVKCQPDLVVIEGTFMRGGGSDIPLISLRAVITQWLHNQGVQYVDVQPATVKVWATGSGATSGENKVTKDKVIAAILAQYGALLSIDPRSDDECDAVALLSMGLAAYSQPLTHIHDGRQTRALSSVTWPDLTQGARA